MKKFVMTAAVALCAVATATAANAAVTYTTTPGASSYAGPKPTYTFSQGSRPVIDGGSFNAGTTSTHATPFGGSGDYYSVGPNDRSSVGGGIGTISLASFGAISSLSFIWGSVDSGNTLSFLDAAGNAFYTIAGSTLLGANASGNQTSGITNPVVTFNFTGVSQAISGMRLTALPGFSNPSGYSFEIDNLAISPIPEPATWGMMLLGLGLAGVSLRRRKTSMARLATA